MVKEVQQYGSMGNLDDNREQCIFITLRRFVGVGSKQNEGGGGPKSSFVSSVLSREVLLDGIVERTLPEVRGARSIAAEKYPNRRGVFSSANNVRTRGVDSPRSRTTVSNGSSRWVRLLPLRPRMLQITVRGGFKPVQG